MADFGQSILRTIRDISSDPRAYLEMVTDRLNNFNKGRVAEINDRGAGYRTLTPDERVNQFVRGATDNIGGGGMGALGVIKNKGGNWLNGSVEKALSGLKSHPVVGGGPRVPGANPEAEAMDKWIEGPLTKYIKRDMATPGDPIRRLAEQGITHFTPDNVNFPISTVMTRRKLGGFPMEGVAVSPQARAWEDISDFATGAQPAKERMRFEHFVEANPWLNKLDPEEQVYHFNNPTGDLGLPHLTDELSNALNPESGLPRHLLLNPEDFQQMGMERAVRHVDAINKWRAAQKAEADMMRANNAATVLHKEYPENNPLGLRWVELKGEQQPLQDALKYEGDTMGHCVGGYCDDVLSGRSRIYSLRDAKGQPHVTIETSPADRFNYADDKLAELPQEEYDRLYNLAVSKVSNPSNGEEVNNKLLELAGISTPKEISDRIIQIKGKHNRAPNPEYLPFVQDFVKSGKWSDVGDLGNTGLMTHRDVWDHLRSVNPEAADMFMDDAGPSGYWSMEDLKKYTEPQGFAEGGLVTNHRRALPESEMPAIISNYQP